MRTVRDGGFTLLELMVSLGIITLLIGLLVPALSGVRRSALVTKDLSNLRNLQTAHLTYATDHRGVFIDVGLPHGTAAGEAEVAWINTLAEYYGGEIAIRSPLDESPHWSIEDGGKGVPVPPTTDRFRRTSYGCNDYLSRYNQITDEPYDRLSKIRSPAGTVHFLLMAFEGEFAAADHVHPEAWNAPFFPDGFAATVAASYIQTNAVDGEKGSWTARSNYGFVDGHVETLGFNEVYIDFETNRFDPERAATFASRTSGGGESNP